jgi:oligopeptide/dipeptide ABC transporter ATP-binding protein
LKKVLLDVKGLKKYFPIHAGVFSKTVGHVKAVDGVDFHIYEGETLGLVGESGCGKSTTGRSVLRLIEPTEGEITFDGIQVHTLSEEKMRQMRRDMQIVFQDPYASLNPRHTVETILEEPLKIHGIGNRTERRKRVEELLDVVGLGSHHAKRYPHEFSGGQRQRIGIARALTLNPKLIVCDEPVSALDVSIQSQVLNLMQDLQKQFSLTYLFIAHDLSVVKHISDRVGVMYLGRIVELAEKDQMYDQPLHPYTRALLSAVPETDPTFKKERIILSGDVPSPSNPPKGCTFHTRCPDCMDICKTVVPEFKDAGDGHYVACHLYE